MTGKGFSIHVVWGIFCQVLPAERSSTKELVWLQDNVAYIWKMNYYFFPIQIKVDDHMIRTEQGLLLRSLQRRDSGIYFCHAVEHGFMQTLLKVTLEVIDTDHLEELLHKEEDGDASKTKDATNSMTPSQKIWYRDFMQLINHPNLNTMDEFCEQVWKRDRKQRRQRPANTQVNTNKWKHLQENKKGRNRRTHEFERAPRSVWATLPLGTSSK